MRPIFSQQFSNTRQSNQQYTYPTNNSNYIIPPVNRSTNSSMNYGNNMMPPPPVNKNTISPQKKPPIKYLAFYTTMKVIYFIKKVKKRYMNRRQRQGLLKQWITTEQSYNTDLRTCETYIKIPMQKQNLITPQQSLILFPELEGMIKLSDMMIQSLERANKKRTKNPHQYVICSQIIKFASGYKLYGGYFGLKLKGSKLLADLAQRKQVQLKNIQAYMQSQLQKKKSKKATMQIRDCMQQPLYRLSKYVLIFKDYMKRLPKQHIDYDAACKCYSTFHEINNFGNDLMKKLQDEQQRVKLDKFCGGALKQGRLLINKMQASTIYFNARIYIFNDMISITKVQSILGSEKQQKYGNFQLDQFSYVAQHLDLKYFNNILILISKDYCVHLFFPDEGSRAQLNKCLFKIIRQLQLKNHEYRKLGDRTRKNQVAQKTKKIGFTLQKTTQFSSYEPEFRVEILGFEVRPLSVITNDTVYCARIMIPNYLQDEINFLNLLGIQDNVLFTNRQSQNMNIKIQNFNLEQKKALKKFNHPFFQSQQHDQVESKYGQKICINQRIQLHFSVLQEIHKQLNTMYPNEIPDIDPITKDVNIYAKGKRKTKAYEMRKFFIEEFINFIFRHEAIMKNPIPLLRRLKINEKLFDYSINRNNQIRKPLAENEKQISFTYTHCQQCRKAQIRTIEQFQNYRQVYTWKKQYDQKAYEKNNIQIKENCFNFFNLLRSKLLSFDYLVFNNLQRILLCYHMADGRLDYPFLTHKCNDKMAKVIKIYLPSLDQNYISINIDSSSTVGQALEELAKILKLKSVFDFDLMATYSGKFRILDRDQYLVDTVNCLEIDYTEVPVNRNNQKADYESKKTGLFDNIKSWGVQLLKKNDSQNKIYFIKTTYLHKSLQLKSYSNSNEKKQLQIQKIFYFIKKALIQLKQQQFIQISAFFYCLRQLDRIQHFAVYKINNATIQKLIPPQHIHAFYNSSQFRNQLGNAIQKQKNQLLKNNKNTIFIHNKVLETLMTKLDYITYFIEVEPRQIPESVIRRQLIPKFLLIGINYKSFVLTRNIEDTTPLITISIKDFSYSHSVFSLFIKHEDSKNNETLNYRFDGKMLFHFTQMIRKYQTLAKKFPQHYG